MRLAMNVFVCRAKTPQRLQDAIIDDAQARGCSFDSRRLPLFEIARVLVRLDHLAGFIINADHGIV